MAQCQILSKATPKTEVILPLFCKDFSENRLVVTSFNNSGNFSKLCSSINIASDVVIQELF